MALNAVKKKSAAKMYHINEEQLVVREFFQKTRKHIEYLDNQDNIHRIYFIMPPQCYYSYTTGWPFLEQYPINSTEEKATFLISKIDEITKDMELHYQQFKTITPLFETINRGELQQAKKLFLLIIILNVFNIILEVDDQHVLHLFTSGLEFDSYLVTHVTLSIFIWIILLLKSLSLIIIEFPIDYEVNKIKYLKEHPKETKVPKWDKLLMMVYYPFLYHRMFKFYIFNLILKTVAFFTDNIYICLMCITVIYIEQRTIYILNSLTKNAKDLIMTFSIMMIVIFIFANIATKYYRGMFYDENRMFPTHPEGNFQYKDICRNTIACFWNFMNYGMRFGGGVGDIFMNLPPEYNTSESFMFKKQLFDLLFFIIVNVLLMGMVSGIIIDTFSELREESDERINHRDYVCYICGKQKKEFDRLKIDFEKHIGKDHNLWDYINYLVSLNIRPSLHDYKELMIWKKYQKEDISWIPIGRSILCEKTKHHVLQKDQQTTFREIEESQDKITNQQNKREEEQKSLFKKLEKEEQTMTVQIGKISKKILKHVNHGINRVLRHQQKQQQHGVK